MPTFRVDATGKVVQNPDAPIRWLIGDLGDSRAATAYSAVNQKGGNNPINVACALSGQRYRMAGGFGISGKRTDEYLSAANMAAVLGSPCGIVRIIGCLNDIAQDYPSASTSGVTAALNVQRAAATLISLGRAVIIEAELGQDNITSARLAQVYEYNQRMREWCERTREAYWHDARPVMLSILSSATTTNFKTNYVYDGIHPSQLGGYYWGKSMKALLDSITPTRQSILAHLSELPGNGRWQLFDNPLFSITTGGSTSTGATGTFPSSCTVNKTGASTAVSCTPAAQNTQLGVTFGAQGDNGRIAQSALIANWSAGDWVQAMCQATITNPSGLAGVQLTMVPSGDSTFPNVTDMGAVTTWAGPDETHTFTFLTDPYQIPNYSSKTSLSATLYVSAFAAGSAFTVSVQQMGIIRRLAGYGG